MGLEMKALASGLSVARSMPIAVPNPSLVLSIELVLIYVLRATGCHGRMTAGRVERIGTKSINVYDESDGWLEYFSGDALRSWCVLSHHGLPYEDWKAVQPEDMEHVLSCALNERRTD